MSTLDSDFVENVEQVRQWLNAAPLVAVLSGAGVSAQSGVPTFRDTHVGYWAQFDPQEMASEAGFRAHPQRVWQWYTYRRQLVAAVQPNAAHTALANFAQAHPRKLRVVTQNVDDLHQRAGQADVIQLHGDLMRNQWLDRCCPQCNMEQALVQASEPPVCLSCGNLLRPGVVWFGEHLPAQALRQAQEAVCCCDLLLVVGTSGVVYPAAGLVFQAHQQGCKVVIINPEDTELDMLADVRLRVTAAQGLTLIFLADRAESSPAFSV